MADSKRNCSESSSDDEIPQPSTSQASLPLSRRDKKLKDDLQKKSETYDAAGVKSTQHGVIYQLKLLMFYAKRCIIAKYNFRLATEMVAAEKFDDVVLEFIKPDNTLHFVFLQAKHIQKENEDSRKIKASDLLTMSDELFSLQKYFRSYQKINKNDKFKESQKYFIIHTNIDFAFDKESTVTIKQLDGLKFEPFTPKIGNLNIVCNDGVKESTFYKLVGTNHKDERNKVLAKLLPLFEETSDLHELAKELAEHLIHQKSIDLKSALFKEYRAALVKEVIDIDNNELRNKFIDLNSTLSSEAKVFRDFLFISLKETLNAKPKIELSPSDKNLLNLSVNSLQCFWNAMGLIKIKTSKGFNKVLKLDKNPTLINPIDCALGIVRLIEKTPKTEPIKIFKSNRSIFPEMFKFAGHILVEGKNENVSFSDRFLKNKSNLPGNLEVFRTELKNELKNKININFDQLKEYAFQITDFVTCEETEYEYLLTKNPTLPSKVHNDEIEGFIDDLIFAVNQPNEIELGNIINKEIGKGFKLIDADLVTNDFQTRMLDWFKEKEGTYITDDGVDSFFADIKEKVSKLVVIGPTTVHMNKLKSSGILFNVNALPDSLIHFLNQSNDKAPITNKFYHLNTEKTSPFLGSVKVSQALEQAEPDYSSEDSFISLNLNTLILISQRVLEAFKKESARLLIVECNSKEQIDVTFNELKTHLDKCHQKRLLLIGPANDALIQNFINLYSKSLLKLDDESNFHDLTDLSKDNLLMKTCQFQEHDVGLNQLFTKNVTNVTDSINLAYLADNETKIEIGNKIPSFEGYNKNYFVERNFLQESAKDPNYPHNSVKIKTTFNDLLVQLKQNTEKKFIILSDVAGMGKSTVLTHLSHEIKAQSPHYWVVKIELSKHTDALKALKSTSFTKESAIDFISKNILHIQTDFEKQLFQHFFQKKEMVLLFDAFDEISPFYETTVLNLLEALKKTENQLWITTRPYFKDSLGFGVSYKLEPFSENDQLTFLTKFWSKTLNLQNETKITKYAEKLLKNLTNTIRDNKFTGIPLQTRMLAEAFETEVKTFHDDKTKNEPTFLKQFDIFDLYAKFYLEKRNITNRKGKVVDEETFKITNEYGLKHVYSNLALLVLFPEHEDCLKINKQKLLALHINRFGIAEIINGKEIQFIHRTFAEYSVAEFFSEALLDNEPRKVCIYFFKNVLLDDNCQVIRYFLDSFLKENLNNIEKVCFEQHGKEIYELCKAKTYKTENNKTILHVAADEGNSHIVKFFAESLKDEYNETSKSILAETSFDQLAWHDAARSGHVEVLEVLWDWSKYLKLNLEALFLRPGYQQGTAWVQASKYDNFDVLKKLWQWASDLEPKGNLKAKLLLSKDPESQNNAFHFATNDKNKQTLQALKDWAKEIKLDFKTELLLSKNGRGQTAFHLAGEKGHVEIVNMLLGWAKDTDCDIKNEFLLFNDKYQTTVLHLAVSQGHVEVIKILQDWAKKNDCYFKIDFLLSKDISRQSAFHLAALYGHVEVLKILKSWATESECSFKNDCLLSEDNQRRTAFHLATSQGHIEVSKILQIWATENNCEFNKNLKMVKTPFVSKLKIKK